MDGINGVDTGAAPCIPLRERSQLCVLSTRGSVADVQNARKIEVSRGYIGVAEFP